VMGLVTVPVITQTAPLIMVTEDIELLGASLPCWKTIFVMSSETPQTEVMIILPAPEHRDAR
jgi:hypothetical protein